METRLIMDINAIPRNSGFDAEVWMHYFQTQGIVFFDSTLGKEPQIFTGGCHLRDISKLTPEELADLNAEIDKLNLT